MRFVTLHCNWIEYEPKVKAIENAEKIEVKRNRVEEVLTILTTVERNDDEEIVDKAVENILEIYDMVKAKRILIYPWVHLSSDIAEPHKALSLLKKMVKKLEDKGIEVYRAPFGWYKAFNVSVKGHPLAELSRRIVKEREKKIVVRRGKKKYFIAMPNGEFNDPSEINLNQFNNEFKILVEKEALGIELKGGEKSKIIEYLNRFGFEWESYSDYGHMRMGPYASIMFDLAAEYSRMVAFNIGIPVYGVKGTAFFNLNVKPVKEHAELYGDRLYTIDTDKGSFVLRYAACHQQFSMIKDWNISYRDLPFGAFEIADSYRYEQSGESELCFRLRRFYMPDLHVFTRDEEEAKKWLLRLHNIIMDEMKKLGRNYELLINVVNPSQFERYKDFIIEICRRIGKPVLIAVYPELGLNYYWTINIEYHILDILNRPREIGTVQIDIGNAERFGITYIDENGEKKYPVIIHTAILGSLERYIYTLIDTALRMNKPLLPTWISPIQVRIIPVKNSFLKYAENIALKLSKQGYRVDIDDTERSVSRKIVDGEREWIPYIVVIGEKEVKSNILTVRIRKDNRVKEMSLADLISLLDEEIKNYPKMPLYYIPHISSRPGFLTIS
ncbi:MAG TPA: threonine--tRNA ligase [Thermoprotei archaeon]|nr:threonine--tRNA ligase [Thermoprotei archaeon]